MSVPVGPFIANMTIEGPVAPGNPGGNPVLTGGVDGSGHTQALQVDSSNNLKVTLGSGTGATQNVSQRPATSGGTSVAKVLSAASTNATSVKASAGQLYSIQLSNTNAAYRFVHFYNKASAPNVGTDVPVFTMGIPPNVSVCWSDANGLAFSTGVAYAISAGAADTDNTAVGANDIVGVLSYA